jgi:ribosome-associated protein
LPTKKRDGAGGSNGGKKASGVRTALGGGRPVAGGDGARPRLKVTRGPGRAASAPTGRAVVAVKPRRPGAAKPAGSAATASDAAPKATRASAAKAPVARAAPVAKAKAPRRAAKDDPARKTALAIAAAGLDKKALNVEIIDVTGRVDYADYVVVMSGRSDRQVQAIARHVEEELLRKEKIRCAGVEGKAQGAWVLMDFGDVVVHVFHEDLRGYYDLESLWIDAARVDLGPLAALDEGLTGRASWE